MSVQMLNRAVTKDVAVIVLSVRILGKTYTGSGSAKRDPVDKADKRLGELLAYGRALDSLGRKIMREANGLVKHHDDLRDIKIMQAQKPVKVVASK